MVRLLYGPGSAYPQVAEIVARTVLHAGTRGGKRGTRRAAHMLKISARFRPVLDT